MRDFYQLLTLKDQVVRTSTEVVRMAQGATGAGYARVRKGSHTGFSLAELAFDPM